MQKIKFFQNSGQYFQICTVVRRSPISALQVGIVKTVKLRHEFAPFLAYILNDLLHCAMLAWYLLKAWHLQGVL